MDNRVPKVVKDGKNYLCDNIWYKEGDIVNVSPSVNSDNLRDLTITEYNILGSKPPKNATDKTSDTRYNLINEVKLSIIKDLKENAKLTAKEVDKIDKHFFGDKENAE